jgi:3-oxoacyl-[acyl-carrier protein] reductase
MKLKNKVAIITGAGTGIGRHVAIDYAIEGATVLVNDLNKQCADETVRFIHEMGGTAVANYGNVASVSDTEAMVNQAVNELGDLDIIVCNAGILRDRMIHNMTEEEWDAVINVHLKGTWACNRAAVRYWRPLAKKQQEQGMKRHRKIINVTSWSGLRGSPGQVNYAAAKLGIVGITKTLAKELGIFHINVNAIAPSALTNMTMGLEDKQWGHLPEEHKNIAIDVSMQQIAMRRKADPSEISPSFVFLAEAASDFITGQVINVDGGWNI